MNNKGIMPVPFIVSHRLAVSSSGEESRVFANRHSNDVSVLVGRDGKLEMSVSEARALADSLSYVLAEVGELGIPVSCPVCSGDCSSANPPVISCPMKGDS